jgi:hypothetical protein
VTPKGIAVDLVSNESEEESIVCPRSHERVIQAVVPIPSREAHHIPRRVMETEAPAHNRHGELVQHQLVQPHYKEIAVGEYGLTLEVIPMSARKAR